MYLQAALPVLIVGLLIIGANAEAACRYQWVDHDYNASTPAIKKQICDSSLDIPAIESPSIRPIQQPQIRPIQTPSIPPIGTSNCRTQSVYENGRWVNKEICR
jgi:hypothetical protein